MRFGPYVKASEDNRKTPIEVSRLWSHCMLFLLILKAAVVQSSMHVPHCKNGDLSSILICTLTRWAKFLVEILVCLLNWINNFLLKTELEYFIRFCMSWTFLFISAAADTHPLYLLKGEFVYLKVLLKRLCMFRKLTI